MLVNEDKDLWFSKFGNVEYNARKIDDFLIHTLMVHYQNTRNYGIGYHKEANRSLDL